MVLLRSGRVTKTIPDELAGIEPPDAYTAALFRFTAAQRRDAEVSRKEKATMAVAPYMDSYVRIKAMSMFPDVFDPKQGHRTFSRFAVTDVEGDRMFKKRSKAEKRQGLE